MKQIHAGVLAAALLIFPTLLSAQTGTGGPDFGGLATSGTGDGRVTEEGDREIILRLMQEIDDWQARLRTAREAKSEAERLAGEKADAIRALGARVQQRDARAQEIQRTIIPQIQRQIGQADATGRQAAANEAEARSQAGAWAADADSADATLTSAREELEEARSTYRRLQDQAAAASSSTGGTGGTGGSGSGSGTGTSSTGGTGGSTGGSTGGTGGSTGGTGGSSTSGTGGTGGTGGASTSGTGDDDLTAALSAAETRVRRAEAAVSEAEQARSEASRQVDIWSQKAGSAVSLQREAALRITSLNADITRLNAEWGAIPGQNQRDRISAEQIEADRQRLLQEAGRSAEDITAAEGELASRQRELAEYHDKYLLLVREAVGEVGGFGQYFGEVEQLGWNRNAAPGVPLIYSLRTQRGSMPLDTIQEHVTTDRQSFVDNAQADKERADGQLESLENDLERLEGRAEREQGGLEQAQQRHAASERELAAAQQQRDDAPSAVTALWGGRKKKRQEAIERLETAETNHATTAARLASARQALSGTQDEIRGKREAIRRQQDHVAGRGGDLERELSQQEEIKRVDDNEATEALDAVRGLL